MRASQHIPTGGRRPSPAQLRLSAGANNRAGLKINARRSNLPRAGKVDLAAAVAGSALIVSILTALTVL